MNKKLLAALVLFLPLVAHGHGPTPQKIEETIMIDAPPDAVWAVVGKFGEIESWHPAVKKSVPSGEHEQADASERDLTLENDEVVGESLDQYESEQHHLAYRLLKENLEALPVSFYSADMQLTATDGGTKVSWSARFYRGDTGNFPPEDLNDQAAIDALTEFFQSGLQGLKERVESDT